MFNKPGSRPVHLTGCIVADVGGSLAPFLWAGKAKLALAIPTSVMGGALLPIAYVTFFLLMNSKSLLGNARPEGWLRLRWNLLMGVATIIAMSGSIWVLKSKTMEIAGSKIPIGKFGIALLVGLLVIGLVQFALKSKKNARERALRHKGTSIFSNFQFPISNCLRARSPVVFDLTRESDAATARPGL